MEKMHNWDNDVESKFIDTEGTYTFKITKYESKETPNGNECHTYTCTAEDGGLINLSLYLVEKAMWKYKMFVKACGLKAEGMVNLDELPNQLVGKSFVGEVKRQPDKLNIVTGLPEPSKYFEIAKFYAVEG